MNRREIRKARFMFPAKAVKHMDITLRRNTKVRQIDWSSSMQAMKRLTLTGLVALIGMLTACNEIQENPRTWGTVGGVAAGAAAGAAIDRDEPARGAIIGGAVGGAAG